MKYEVIRREKLLSGGLIAGNTIIGNEIFLSYNSGGDISPGQTSFGALIENYENPILNRIKTFESIFNRGGTEAGCSISSYNGRIFFPYSDGFYIDPENSLERRAIAFCPYSDDKMISWKGMKAIGLPAAEAFAFGRVINHGGELKLSLWGSIRPGDKWESGLLTSTNNGETWGNYRTIANHANETVIESFEGKLIALIRGLGVSYNGFSEVTVRSEHEKRGLFISESEDNGKTWSEPVLSGIWGTAPSLAVSKTGELWAGYRAVKPGGVCKLAKFDGEKFIDIVNLEIPDVEWKYGGYPVISFMESGELFVTFHYMYNDEWIIAYNLISEIP